MRTNNPKTINEQFDLKYGKKGTDTRIEFEQNAEAYLIAELIKEKRKESNMTQQELAEKLNVKRTYISKIERAVGEIRISTLRRIVEQGFGGSLQIKIML